MYLAWFFAVLFGCGSWIAINGIWSESPVLWPLSPDCLHLASITTVVVQLANVGPVSYLLISRFMCKGRERQARTFTICVIYVLGVAACVQLSILWDRTSVLGGHRHSTALIVLIFVLGLVDCTSSVTFLPFMGQYPKEYLNWLYVGEGLSSLIPSCIALIQTSGVDKDNVTHPSQYNCSLSTVPTRFSPNTYFGFLTGLVLASAFGFLFLTYYGRLESSPVESNDQEQLPQTEDGPFLMNCCSSSTVEQNENEQLIQTDGDHAVDSPVTRDNLQSSQQQIFWSRKLVVLLILVAWINCLFNGLIPSLSSYAFTPYGSADITVNVGMVAGTLTAFASLILAWEDSTGKRAFATIVTMEVIATILGGYIIWIASPMCNSDRPLLGTKAGTAHMVLVNFFASVSAVYAKVAIAQGAKKLVGEKALLACGIATQIGSCIGAFTIFGFVTTGHFNQPTNCSHVHSIC